MENPVKPSRFVDVVRWILFLPAAVAAGFFAPALFTLLNAVSRFGWGEAMLPYLQCYFMGVGVVAAGAWVAPRGKMVVAIALCLLTAIFATMLFLANVAMEAFSGLVSALFSLLVIVGSGCAAYAVHVEGERFGESKQQTQS